MTLVAFCVPWVLACAAHGSLGECYGELHCVYDRPTACLDTLCDVRGDTLWCWCRLLDYRERLCEMWPEDERRFTCYAKGDPP